MPHSKGFGHSVDIGIKHLSHNPSQNSRLGDVGYTDQKGGWRPIINVLDQGACEQLGIKALQLAQALPNYLTQTRDSRFQDHPFVKIFDGGEYEILSSGKLERIINEDSYALDERNLITTRQSRLGLMIKPKPNTSITTFIASPNIFVRKLHLPYDKLYAWLRTYRTKIAKVARQMFSLYPPTNRSGGLCLSLTESLTETWKTIFIRTDIKASPIVLAWKAPMDNVPGSWTVVPLRDSSSTVFGAFGSFPDGSKWTIGSDGIPFQLPSILNFILPPNCLLCAIKENLEEPIPPDKDMEKEATRNTVEV